MGMDAELLAIGPYHPDLVNCLDYPASYYTDTPVGSTIIITVGISATTEQSSNMASALRIDPWQFQEHCNLTGDDVDLELLTESFGENAEKCVCDFLKLREYGFKFFYMPEG